MSHSNRFVAGFLVVLSIAALILLSIGLPSLKFEPGNLFQDGLIRELQELLWASRGLLDFAVLLFIFLPVMVAILFFLQPARSKNTSQRKRSILSSIIQLTLLLTALVLLRRRLNLEDFQLNLSKGIGQSIAEFEFLASESAVSTLPWWLNFILSFFLIATVLLIVVRALPRTQKNVKPSVLITKEAHLAVQEINQGKSFNNVILDCYYEMTRILKEQQGISRDIALTPREFEKHLLYLGFPEKPVIWLTRLFEQVRYGNQEVEDRNQNLAVRCLNEIIERGEII